MGFGPLTTAPDGTTSAKLMGEANPGNGVALHYAYIYADLGIGQRTLSFHFKADLDSWVYITSTVDGVTQRVWFNLTGNGAVGANIPAGWSAQITPLPNGWYRCSVTFSVVDNGLYNGFGLATMDQQYAYVGTIGNAVYEWGQQFQDGPLTDYQANLSPCLTLSKSADAGSVTAGSSIGYTIQAFNQASPALATTLNDPLPPGTGINWSISPTYGGLGTCAITGVVGSQTLACDFSTLPAGVGTSVHITSGTSASSCGTYSNIGDSVRSQQRFVSGERDNNGAMPQPEHQQNSCRELHAGGNRCHLYSDGEPAGGSGTEHRDCDSERDGADWNDAGVNGGGWVDMPQRRNDMHPQRCSGGGGELSGDHGDGERRQQRQFATRQLRECQ